MARGNQQTLTELDIRLWLRDNDPQANTLLDDLEFSSEEIRAAMTYAQDYWNETPPLIGSMDYTNTPYRFHLLMGTVAQLLMIAAMRYRRNALPYSAGGVSVQDQEKADSYDRAGDRLWQQYREWTRQVKVATNMTRCWGHCG